MNYCESSSQNKKSLFLNNNNNMDPQTTSCPSKSLEDRPNEDFPNFNDTDEIGGGADSENENNINSDSDEMFVNSFDDAEVSEDELSSPSNSHNSDLDQRWYAFRGRIVGIPNDNRPDNRFLEDNQLPPPPVQQEEEETDFLEMDFEPDTNSEIENEAKFSDYVLPNGHQHAAALNFHHLTLPLPPQPEFLSQPVSIREEPVNLLRPMSKNTGAKPKQLSAISRPQKPSKHVSDGDNVFKVCTTSNKSFVDQQSSSLFRPSTSNEVYNLGASSSRATYHDPNVNDVMKIHKSPSKSSSHNNKHLRLHEEQNDQFLFEIEPIKPRNSVTIYTTNCDEKILIDALVSLNLEPNREMIAAYFNRTKPSISGCASNCELNLVDYIIYRSKLNCNYLKLIELIQKACRNESDDDSYSDKKFEVNFYPLDLFSSTPEMVEIEVNEIVQRWTAQTDLSPLVNIRNKYFYQTNVLGKVVNIIRKINQKPPATFKDKETIKIPQFYNSGYVTITTNHGYKS